MPSSPFTFEQQDNILIVVPKGSMMEYRDEDLRTAYNETYRRICQQDVKHLLVDFSSLDYFGSTFIGMLIRLAKATRKDGGDAALCELSDNMKEMMKTLMLLENTKTDFFWTPYPTRVEALTALGEKTSADKAPASNNAAVETPDGEEVNSGGAWGRYM